MEGIIFQRMADDLVSAITIIRVSFQSDSVAGDTVVELLRVRTIAEYPSSI